MKPLIIIFHGYESSLDSEKYQNLPFESIGINMNYHLPFYLIKTLFEELIQKHLDRYMIFLGHSLGGWWARYFAKKYNRSALLLNPVVDINRVNIDIPNKSFYQNTYSLESYPRAEIQYYIELPDEVITYNFDALEKEGSVEIGEGNHRIKHKEKISELLLKLEGNLFV
jgi:predicted esterase YcpF (UPF0227 family)